MISMPWFGVMHMCNNANSLVARGATCQWQVLGGKRSTFTNYGGFPMVQQNVFFSKKYCG